MTTDLRQHTIKDYLALPDNDNKHYELLDGRLIEVAPANEEHCRVGNTLNAYFTYYVLSHKLGHTYGPDAGFQIGADVLGPDMAFVKAGRLEASQRGLAIIPLAPDLVLEVVSPSETRADVINKVRKYQQAGVELIWVLRPKKKTVAVYGKDDVEPKVLGIEDDLEAGEVIAGFKLKIADLFEMV